MPIPAFNYNQDFSSINFREHPEAYQVGKGEQGVLLVQPYKGEILPHWRFRTPEIAKESSEAIRALFDRYKQEGDFVGMDMARKFLQMGYTRSRRYANHASGRKYAANPQKMESAEAEKLARTAVLPQAKDWGTSEKAESARIFYTAWQEVEGDGEYKALRKEHKQKYG